ncbi:hypothetical protein COCOBI_18-2130 [Coccomyxa sp. Obi]|nr:hypothetical protein COCOBI_18-2130 [Coccomyxa sp. Obi]
MLPPVLSVDRCSLRPAISSQLGACSRVKRLKSITQRRHASQTPLTKFWETRPAANYFAAEASVDARENGAQEYSNHSFGQFPGKTGAATPGGKTLEASKFKLADIFGNHVFSLFKAQRPYLWTVDLALKLLEDFLTQVKDGSSNELGLFSLGMMNVCEVSKEGSTVLELLDGQQRLVTLCIILAAIRKKLLDHGGEEEIALANKISTRLWQPKSVDEDLPARPRLELKRYDVAFFNQILRDPSAVDGTSGPSSLQTSTQENIWRNLQAIKGRLEECSTQQIIAVYKYIINRTHIIVAEYKDTEAALQVYRTGNMGVGMKLAPMDLLKADVLEHVQLEDQLDVTNSWEELETEVGREVMSDLLSEYLVAICLGKRPRTHTELEDLNEVFHASWRRHIGVVDRETDTTAGLWFTKEFLPLYARASADLAAYKLPGTPNLREVKGKVEYYLKLLRRLPGRVRDGWMPAALVLAVECSGCDIEVKLDVLFNLERLSWYLLLRGADINVIHRRFSQVTASLRKQGGGLKKANRVAGLELTSEEKDEMLERLNDPIYKKSTWNSIARPLLARLNEYYLNRNDQGYVKYDIEDLTVEHIMPQNVKSGSSWEKDIPDGNLRQQWVPKLGNLKLLSVRRNSAASNHDFEQKKTHYLGKKKGGQANVNNIPLTDKVATLDKWTIEELEERQAELLNLAKFCWELY